MQEPRTWRGLLGQIISDPGERQRIASELGINTITLMRWVNSESIPRSHNLRLLLDALPQHRRQLLELITEEFKDFPITEGETGAVLQDIPAEFYAHLLHTRAGTPRERRFWPICNLILPKALEQLDAERFGLSITVVRCMPPTADHKIRSLRESIGLGTPPWGSELEQKALLLGAESLAGYVVASCRAAIIQSLTEGQTLFPAHRVEYEESAAAYPIMDAGLIAGCLLISSALPHYFLAPSRLALIQNYADLIALAFEPGEFYDPQTIELRIMPPHHLQQPFFDNFRQRVARIMIEAGNSQHPLNSSQAEQLAWHQLEEELLRLPYQSEL